MDALSGHLVGDALLGCVCFLPAPRPPDGLVYLLAASALQKEFFQFCLFLIRLGRAVQYPRKPRAFQNRESYFVNGRCAWCECFCVFGSSSVPRAASDIKGTERQAETERRLSHSQRKREGRSATTSGTNQVYNEIGRDGHGKGGYFALSWYFRATGGRGGVVLM